jgi:hypothetical protein
MYQSASLYPTEARVRAIRFTVPTASIPYVTAAVLCALQHSVPRDLLRLRHPLRLLTSFKMILLHLTDENMMK